MNKPNRCSVAEGRFGPPHSMYGQSDSGICYCLGCAGDEEDWEEVTRWWEQHITKCSQCKAYEEASR